MEDIDRTMETQYSKYLIDFIKKHIPFLLYESRLFLFFLECISVFYLCRRKAIDIHTIFIALGVKST